MFRIHKCSDTLKERDESKLILWSSIISVTDWNSVDVNKPDYACCDLPATLFYRVLSSFAGSELVDSVPSEECLISCVDEWLQDSEVHDLKEPIKMMICCCCSMFLK